MEFFFQNFQESLSYRVIFDFYGITIFEKFSRKSCFVIFAFWLYTAHSRISKRFDQSFLFLLSSRFPDRTCSKNKNFLNFSVEIRRRGPSEWEGKVFDGRTYPWFFYWIRFASLNTDNNGTKTVIDWIKTNDYHKWKPIKIEFEF